MPEKNIEFAMQALPDLGNEKLLIPVDLNAPKGSTVTFAVLVTNLPGNIPLYLEDRLTGKFARLDEPGSSYTATLNVESKGTGRFFLVTSPLITGNDLTQVELLTIVPFPLEHKIRITGKFAPSAVASIYTTSGQKVCYFMLSQLQENEIPFKPSEKGIYILRLQSGTTTVSRKINWTV